MHCQQHFFVSFSALALVVFGFETPSSRGDAVHRIVLAGDSSSDVYTLEVPNSSTTVDDAFDATLTGASSDGKYAVNIHCNSGTVTQSGRSTTVTVSQQIPYSPYTLYAILGEDDTGLMLGWVYCEGDDLIALWLEDTTGLTGFTPSMVTGTCSISTDTDNVSVITTAEQITIQIPASYPTITGSDISLQANSIGSVNIQNQPYDLVPFALVNCSNCSASSINGGWVEVHSVMHDKNSGNICLGIFYLPIKHTPTIALDYVNCFVDNVGDQTFSATYSIP